MLLESLQTARCVLLKDDIGKNVVPIVVHTVLQVSKEVEVSLFCYERPIQQWKENIRSAGSSVKFYCEDDPETVASKSDKRTAVFIDSFDQMSLVMGVQKSFLCLHKLLRNSNVTKVFLVYHLDCQKSPKIEIQLDHIAQLIVTSNHGKDRSKLIVKSELKKAGKFIRMDEEVSYSRKDNNIILTTSLISNKRINDEIEQILPHKLTTFKIGVENKEAKARDELELPYLKKQESGKVYYEHDAADDWDDEDPDEDLDV